MDQEALKIRKQDLDEWLGELCAHYEVIAPVKGPGGEAVFSRINASGEALRDFENPLSPPKQFVLPQTDPILEIRRNGGGIQLTPVPDGGPKILFNIRPCDAKAISFLTRMHQVEPADESYLRRARNITLITLACTTPCTDGFCVCSDSGPFSKTSHDLQLVDLGESYLAEIGTGKGKAAMLAGPRLFVAATDDDLDRRQQLEAEAMKHFGQQTCHFASAMRRVSTGRVSDALWDQMSDWCLECGGCTFICPTCYCFNVRDRGSDGAWTRCRTWDSCQYAAFTLEASGHNPRSQRRERMKRRFFHKVSAQYYVRDGIAGCVGCGRCVRVCLGETDMPAVVGAIRKGAWHGR